MTILQRIIAVGKWGVAAAGLAMMALGAGHLMGLDAAGGDYATLGVMAFVAGCAGGLAATKP